MVRLREDDPPSREAIEEIHIPIPWDMPAIRNAPDFMSFVREQLKDLMQPHDKKQDDFIAKLPNLLFLPNNASAETQRIYNDLSGKKERLLKIQRERIELTAWLWSYCRRELPDVTQDQARQKMTKLFAGKQRFCVISKQVEDALYKLHAIAQ